MNDTVQIIPLTRLALAFIPVCAVLFIIHRWSLGIRTGLVAVFRMVSQLLLVGYVLTFIFGSQRALVTVSVVAISAGALTVLFIATQVVLDLPNWYTPSMVIPLAGIVLANSMNTVSLAAERFRAERERGANYREARHTAMSISLIPMTNSLLAVGLVSLPGMMTGQILSGVTPLIAVRYQILVMCMIFGSAGLATSCYLVLQRPRTDD
jgi:putative ABC transport system permease protein